MKLSSAYILEQLKKEYRVQDQNKISGEDGFFRPLFVWIMKRRVPDI